MYLYGKEFELLAMEMGIALPTETDEITTDKIEETDER